MSESIDKRTRRARRLAARQSPAVEQPKPPPEEPVTTNNGPSLAELGVPERYRDELEGAGITTLAELKAFGDLTAIKGIGPKGAQEIAEAVAAYEAR